MAATGHSNSERTWLVGPWYDRIFFLYSPLAAIGIALVMARLEETDIQLFTVVFSVMVIFWFVLESMGDLGFIRCYLNPRIFKTYWFRLTVVPIVLFVAVHTSVVAFICLFIFEVFVDVYHSSNQTFGIARIYEAKHGNPSNLGRKLDYGINYAIYAAPIIIGSTAFLGHLESLEDFDEIDDHGQVFGFLATVPDRVMVHHQTISMILIVAVLLFGIYYVAKFRQLEEQGAWRFNRSKVTLYVTTAVCCYYVWLEQNFLVAYIAVNVFHGWQYLGLTWWSERKNLRQVFRLPDSRFGWVAVLLIFGLIGMAFGLFEQTANMASDRVDLLQERTGNDFLDLLDSPAGWFIKTQVVTNLMHYYTDMFIWSIRRTQVVTPGAASIAVGSN